LQVARQIVCFRLDHASGEISLFGIKTSDQAIEMRSVHEVTRDVLTGVQRYFVVRGILSHLVTHGHDGLQANGAGLRYFLPLCEPAR
jgi:hypothetical protein